MDSRIRSGFFAVQFERLIASPDPRSVALDTPPARFLLTRYDNVVSCHCVLKIPDDQGVEALSRRGAVEGTFMIRRNLAPREFGMWLDQLLIDDLQADPGCQVEALTQETLTVSPWESQPELEALS